MGAPDLAGDSHGETHKIPQIQPHTSSLPSPTTDPQSPSSDLPGEGPLNGSLARTEEISSPTTTKVPENPAEGDAPEASNASRKETGMEHAIIAAQEVEILAELSREIRDLLQIEESATATNQKPAMVADSEETQKPAVVKDSEEQAAPHSIRTTERDAVQKTGREKPISSLPEEAGASKSKHSSHSSVPQRSSNQADPPRQGSHRSTTEAKSSSTSGHHHSRAEKVKGIEHHSTQPQASSVWGRGANVASTSTLLKPGNQGNSKEDSGQAWLHQSTPQQALSKEEWKEVKAPYWWRQEQKQAGSSAKEIQRRVPTRGMEKFKQHTYGKCFNCFAADHQVRHCHRDTRCWRCEGSGHHAHQCKLRPPATGYKQEPPRSQTSNREHHYPQAHTSATERKGGRSYLEAAKGVPAAEAVPTAEAMAAYPGDPRARPSGEAVFVSATGDIKRRRDDLVARAAVCWLRGDNHDSKPHHVVDALRSKMDMGLLDFQVVKHFPEQYLIIFSTKQLQHRVIRRQRLEDGGRVFNFAPWTETREAVDARTECRVNLRLEGIPPHAWGQEVAAMILGRSCAIHYVEEHTRRRERTRTFDLWAWCADPSKIPKKVWLTISDPDAEQPPINIPRPQVRVHHDEPTGTKHGLTYGVLPHLEVVEDLTFLDDEGGRGGPPNRRRRRTFVWRYGEEDSLGEVRGHRDGERGREIHRRRDDYDDDQGGHQRRRRSYSAWGRASRCREGAVDCYSSNIRAINYNYGSSFRSRGLMWVPKERSTHQKSGAKIAPSPATIMVELLHPSTESKVSTLGMQMIKNTEASMSNIKVPHLDNPITKIAMDALQGLVDHGTMMMTKSSGIKTKGAAARMMVA